MADLIGMPTGCPSAKRHKSGGFHRLIDCVTHFELCGGEFPFPSLASEPRMRLGCTHCDTHTHRAKKWILFSHYVVLKLAYGRPHMVIVTGNKREASDATGWGG